MQCCAACGSREDADLTCSNCRSVVYCSRSCQRAHWKNHKKDCEALALKVVSEVTVTMECPQFLGWLDSCLRIHRVPALLGGPPTGPLVLRSPAPCRRRAVETAGRAFLEGYERSMPSFQPAKAPAQEEAPPKRRPLSNRSGRTKPYLLRCQERAERRSKLRPGKGLSRRLQGVELYTLLEIQGVTEEGFPSMEEVKEAYKRLVLIHHPDKKASKSLAFQLIQEAYEYLSDPENKQMYDSTLPFDDSIPTRAELCSRGFFKSLEDVFRRNARFSEVSEVPLLGTVDEDVDRVHDFYEWWYHFESWRDVSPAYLEKHGLELEDIQDCPRHQRRGRQKRNEQIRKQFDAQERLRLMRLVDLAWQNDPRLHWVSLDAKSAVPAKTSTTQPRFKPRADTLNAVPKVTEEEKRKQEEAKRIAKGRRQQLRKLVESLGLLVSGVELERYCLKVPGDAEELEDLADEVQRLAELPAEEVTEELTETDEELNNKKKTEEAEVPSCTFCNGTGLNCVSKCTCMFCDGSGKQKVEEKVEAVEDTPQKEKRYRRKTPKQLAQEAIFEAMWASGMRPTETRHSPELRQERRERQEREREERRLRREQRQKEEKENEAKWKEALPKAEEPRSPKKRAKFAVPEAVEIQPKIVQEEDLRMEEAEAVLGSLEHDTNPETVDKIAKLTEFARVGIEGSTQVILASLIASNELRMLLAELEDRRVQEPDHYADEALLLLSECVAPFFALGLRPGTGAAKLPALLRNRVKRVRQALRDLVVGCDFLAILHGEKQLAI